MLAVGNKVNLDHDEGCTHDQHPLTLTGEGFDVFIDVDNDVRSLYHKEIQSQIDAIDEEAVLGWFILDLFEHERMDELKYGVSFGLGPLGALSLQDQMQELNRVLADLQMQTVKPCICLELKLNSVS